MKIFILTFIFALSIAISPIFAADSSVKQSGGDFTTLNAALADAGTGAGDTITISGTWSVVDSAACTVIDDNITIIATGDSRVTTARHVAGSPDHYRLEVSGDHCITVNNTGCVIDGLDIQQTGTGSSDEGVRMAINTGTLTIKNNIIWADTKDADQDGVYAGRINCTVNIENTIIYGFHRLSINAQPTTGTAVTQTWNINSSSIFGSYTSADADSGGIGANESITGHAINMNIFNTWVLDSNTGSAVDYNQYNYGTTDATVTWQISYSIDSDNSIASRDAGGVGNLASRTIRDSQVGGNEVLVNDITGSPPFDLSLIDNGNNNDAQDAHTTNTAEGMTITATDIDGTARPQNTNHEIGVFEILGAVAIPVVPGGEGWGMFTLAGSGSSRGVITTVYKVTNLNSSGAGSLANVINSAGPRTVIFETSGTIDMAGANLQITNPYLTLAGQTAPEPGIIIQAGSILIQTHDVLIQHIRNQWGDDLGSARSGVRIRDDGAEDDVYNNVIDHCSFLWSTDEGIEFWTDNPRDCTVVDTIVAEGLWKVSPFYEGKGIYVGINIERISLIRNLQVSNQKRNPLHESGSISATINCLLYNHIQHGLSYSDNGTRLVPIQGNAVGNVCIDGPSSTASRGLFVRNIACGDANIYLSDNLVDGSNPVDPWDNVSSGGGLCATWRTDFAAADWVAGAGAIHTDIMAASAVKASVLDNVGAYPAFRDFHDLRIIDYVRNGTETVTPQTPNFPIENESDVGGRKTIGTNTRTLTVPANKDSDDNGDGYTNLENWLHTYLAGVEIEATTPPPSSGKQIITITQKERK